MGPGLKRVLLFATVVSSAFGQSFHERELSLGRQMGAEIESREKMITDAEVIAFLHRVLKALSQDEALRLPLELKVIDNPDILVASVLPGGICC